LLSDSVISSALGVRSTGGKTNSRAMFVGCDYTLAGAGGSGTMTLYVATVRGPQIYSATQEGGGFADVSGVGTQAAYNAEDGRFIVATDKAFVEIMLPVNLKGATSSSTSGAERAGVTLAKHVLSGVH
jgi:hypothetical protein